VLGAVLVFFFFPKHDAEQALLVRYHDDDEAEIELRERTSPTTIDLAVDSPASPN
jgi:hypothetical protein